METIVGVFAAYPWLLDFSLYLLVFTAAARVGFAKSFPSHEGKVLAVAVGLFLAASLAIAQRNLGFSLERMGPVAAFILCGIVFIASYRFMQHADVPKPLTILLAGLMGLALARAVLPNATASFMRENSLMVTLVTFGIICWAWYNSQSYLDRVQNRRPGRLLGKNHIVPDDDTLKKEARFTKKRLRDTTKTERKEERALASDIDKASGLLEKGKHTVQDRGHVARLLNSALEKANHVHKNCERLLQADNALLRFDAEWLRKGHAFNVNDLTPEQRTLLRESILEERRRIGSERKTMELENEVKRHLATMTEYVRKARASFADGSGAGAAGSAGWLDKAREEAKKTKELEGQVLDWEKRLVRLVKRQLATMRKAE
jgi:hypothetical protein